jgi:hypothetical protein
MLSSSVGPVCLVGAGEQTLDRARVVPLLGADVAHSPQCTVQRGGTVLVEGAVVQVGAALAPKS